MADTQPKKLVMREIQVDPNDPSQVRMAVMIDAVLLAPVGSADPTLTFQLSDGGLGTMSGFAKGLEVWRYYEGGSTFPSYVVTCKPTWEALCSQEAIDEFDRRIKLGV